jgi:hypothetical protein
MVDAEVKPGLATRMSSNADKAGLEHCDKDKVNQVISQSTKGTSLLPLVIPSILYSLGSRFSNKTKKDDDRTQVRVENMMKAYSHMKKEDFTHYTRSADRLIDKLEAERDLSAKSWLHVDMDGS